jgi:hypothetical protein
VRKTALATVAALGVLAAGCTTAPDSTPGQAAPVTPIQAPDPYCPTYTLDLDGSCLPDLAATVPGDVVWAGTSEFVALDGQNRPCGDIEAGHVPVLPLTAQDPHAARGARPLFNWLVTVKAGVITFTYPPEKPVYRAIDHGNGIYYTGRDCPK